MSNVGVVVEDEPPAGLPLLGLYQGVPLTRRTSSYAAVPPDKITIYRGPARAPVRGRRARAAGAAGGAARDRAPLRDQRRAPASSSTATELRVLGRDEAEHERLREAARVAAVRDPARVHAGDPHAVGGAGTRVDLDAAVRVRDRRIDADAQAAAGERLRLLRVRELLGDLGPRERLLRRARTRLGRPAGRRSPARGRSPTTRPRRGRTPRRGRSRGARSGRRAGRRRRTRCSGTGPGIARP